MGKWKKTNSHLQFLPHTIGICKKEQKISGFDKSTCPYLIVQCKKGKETMTGKIKQNGSNPYHHLLQLCSIRPGCTRTISKVVKSIKWQLSMFCLAQLKGIHPAWFCSLASVSAPASSYASQTLEHSAKGAVSQSLKKNLFSPHSFPFWSIL